MLEVILLAALSLLSAILSLFAGYKWRGKFVPVNSLIFVAVAIVSMMLFHYFINLHVHPEFGHRYVFGIRTWRVIVVATLSVFIGTSLSTFMFKVPLFRRPFNVDRDEETAWPAANEE